MRCTDPTFPSARNGEPADPTGGVLRRWCARFLGALLSWTLRLQRSTWRIDTAEHRRLDTILEHNAPVLAAFWHGKYTALFALIAGRQASVFASDSFRGRVIASICRQFGFHCVLVRAGDPERAVEVMRGVMRGGHLCATAADGPLGPRRQFKPRLLELAAELGYRVVPLSVVCTRKWTIWRRWDRREIPFPFSRVRLRVGEPIALPQPLPPSELAVWQRKLERSLNDLEEAQRPESER